jgi:hypothetical protein
VVTAIARFATKEPTICAVCRRRAMWLGYAPHHSGWPIWLCGDDGCHASARKVYAMPNPILDAYEIGSALEAGAEAGRYLEEIDRFDLRTLDDGEWREFLHRLYVGFEQVMRRKILGEEAPF